MCNKMLLGKITGSTSMYTLVPCFLFLYISNQSTHASRKKKMMEEEEEEEWWQQQFIQTF